MLSHIDEFACCLYTMEGGLKYSLGTADEGHDCAVCGLARVYIKYLDAGSIAFGALASSLDFGYNGINYIPVASFAEIRYAFDNSFHVWYV